jgi:hypothetical protein
MKLAALGLGSGKKGMPRQVTMTEPNTQNHVRTDDIGIRKSA